MKYPYTAFSIVTATMLLLAFTFLSNEKRVFTNTLGMEMIPIEPGHFIMGHDGSRHYWNEGPAHSVTLTQPFAISRTEITLEQFRAFRPDFEGTAAHVPFAAGVSWHDAAAFAAWLSEEEGRPYRLPTEAEWEYVARGLGGGDAAEQMLSGAREWVHDWFGAYPAGAQTDPVGPANGYTRVVRGGALDIEERNFLEIDFARPESRLAMAPAFGVSFEADTGDMAAGSAALGLIGVWYTRLDFTDPRESTVITRLDNNWSNDPRGSGRWAATWRGYLEAPVTGDVVFLADAASPFRLELAGETAIDAWEGQADMTHTVRLEKGSRIPIAVSFARQGSRNHFSLFWEWDGHAREVVPASAISYSAEQARLARAEATADIIPGRHAIGFRLVLGEMPETEPVMPEAPIHQIGVRQNTEMTRAGPDPDKPYFRKRYYLPTPLENSTDEEIDAAGLHSSFRPHNHSPALEVMPNGDVLMVIYTSYREYEPGVSLIASRLRFGAEEWDPPATIADLVGMNDHAPLLWNDGGAVHLFWGSPKLGEGAFPFQWMSSTDNGASWGPIRFPHFVTDIGSHSRQPINSAFRDERGRMHVASDGSGGESVLWASDDNGATWLDTGGRSGGRHTTFALLNDGRILGMGGKNTQIDEYMPRSISADDGQSYEISKTPFPQQGSNQRPTLLRLQSGRLFFAGDFIHLNTGSQPKGLNQTGSYVALSEDEGETWFIKKLIGAQPHENREVVDRMRGATLGYSVARQAPNGMIHLIGTMTNPNLHFELNEAWILEGDGSERPDAEMMTSHATAVANVQAFEELYPDGAIKGRWRGGVADDGRFLLHGKEEWHYENGAKHWEVAYRLGRKVGEERRWARDGRLVESWVHREDGSSTWTQYGSGGEKKTESTWRNFHAEGPARHWSAGGALESEIRFDRGRREQ